MSTDASNGTTAAGPGRQVELFVKAGKNGESYGACPVCQRFFMILLTKADYDPSMSLIVTTVNMAKPPDHFKGTVNRLPVLNYDAEMISDQDEMVQIVDRQFRYPPMAYDNVAAALACRDVFQKFSFYIKDVSQSPDALLAELRKLNDYLHECPHRFLCRDIPDHLDCLMLPKLQHVRVAARAFKNFEFPVHLRALWRYLATAYATPAFRESCPSDQEIVYHWQTKPECPALSKELQQYYSPEGQPPRHSFGVPKELEDLVHAG